MICDILQVRDADIDADTPFGDFGFDSVSIMELANRIGDTHAVNLPPTAFFEHPTLNKIIQHIKTSAKPSIKTTNQDKQTEIADTNRSETQTANHLRRQCFRLFALEIYRVFHAKTQTA